MYEVANLRKEVLYANIDISVDAEATIGLQGPDLLTRSSPSVGAGSCDQQQRREHRRQVRSPKVVSSSVRITRSFRLQQTDAEAEGRIRKRMTVLQLLRQEEKGL